MDIPWDDLLLAVVSALVGASGTALFVVLRWNVEMRRMKTQYRRNRIAQWRQLIHKATAFSEIRASTAFAEIQPYLTEAEKLNFSPRTVIATAGGSRSDDAKQELLLRVVHRIEEAWDLI